MIELCRGNLLEAAAEALINTVNTEGIMGKGVALQFKRAFPAMFTAYQEACKAGEVKLGQVHVYETGHLIGPRYIINFPTKGAWRKPSRLEYIRSGLASLVKEIRSRGIRSLAMPPLGCGMGGLDWNDVYQLITKAMETVPEVKVLLFPPQPPPEARRALSRTERPEMTLRRAYVLSILSKYCVLGYELTLLEVHKLLYFFQEAGEPLQLRFAKKTYGPYANNLQHLLLKFEGHFSRGIHAGSNKPDTKIELIPEAVSQAESLIRDSNGANQGSAARMQKVTDLIEGFESPYGMELLASVHWIHSHEGCMDEEQIIEAVHSWSERKRKILKPEHIRIAWRRLKEKNWIKSL